ncbi:transcription factor tfiiic complex subunit tfc6 [Histoplasma capsulatum var. duboisii H88]|uniref:Transcription factor tfiiic complex subunit tfc6 n=1 Tax=Ajellomyces capsulatus (strain H88) TaxID=544711 RepID=F0U8N7_AJEC8|nr:transcription factor tfiiic complex subunit tfc6 [Histoplasma capsulatum var. duboisii H88]QSS52622.1 transcription factor tfiiic complex subunit tfc6 [Histoplasma capsulatum var. duboisii H88]
MASSPIRRSTRRRTAVPEYTTDVFAVTGLQVGSSEPEQLTSDEEEETEISNVVATGRRGAKRSVRRGTRRRDDEAYEEQDNDAERMVEEDDIVSALGSDLEETDKARKARSRPVGRVDEQDPMATHSRGLYKSSAHGAKVTYLKLTFGSSDEDLLPMVYTRVRWTKRRDVTFPSSDTLREAFSMTIDEIGAAFGVSGDLLRKEATSGWDWYYDENASDRFRKRQQTVSITAVEGKRYIPRPGTKKHTVIIGPASSQKVYELDVGQSLDFGQSWSEIRPKGERPGRPKNLGKQTPEVVGTEEPLSPESELASGIPSGSATQSRRTREGWILNLGNKIQCVSWAPNCTGGSQYLAVAVPISGLQKQSLDLVPQGPPAFMPSPPYPSAIQIWSFESTKENSDVHQLDMAVKPRLRQVICTDAGDIRRLSWCPMGRDKREGDDTVEGLNIGLLAGAWGDGSIKVLDVQLKKLTSETEYVQVHVPAFEAKLPSTLCTCFCWLSPSDLAFGTASGFVGVWSLSSPSDANESVSNPAPYIYFPIHTSYILNITSSYPTHPHILVTTGMDGKTKLFSLLDPRADVTETSRSRVGSYEVSYSPFLRTYICSDDTEFIRIQPLRRFFSTSSILQTYDLVSAITPATLCHPCFLAGNVSGNVAATNPLRRLMSPKEKTWQQTWFSHQWIPNKHEEVSVEQKDGVVGPGVSKFYDGFKAEIPTLVRKLTGDRRMGDGNLAIATFEEKTAVTALSWNPNKACAGWACAGLGCGLLRVEDLALR